MDRASVLSDPMLMFFRTSSLLVVVACCLVSPVVAADPGDRSGQEAPGRQSVSGDARPAFRIAPIVHRVEERRNKVIDCEYLIESLGADSLLQIRPVAMRQEENGVVLPDTDSPPPAAVKMLSPERVELRSLAKHLVKVQIRVPDENCTFHSFGILVKDEGRILPKGQQDAENKGTTIGIRFVTQYLLRCDISVLGQRGEYASKLHLESAAVVAEQGLASARVFVTNPTDTPIEFGVRVSVNSAGAERPAFPLICPVRSGYDGDERYIARILPGARIRLEEFIPYPIFGGDYELITEIVEGSSTRKRESFPFHADDYDFPAQNVAVAQIADGVFVTPPQVELSLQKGGDRARTVSIQNNRTTPVEVGVKALLGDDSAVAGLVVRPESVVVPPRGVKKVQLMLNAAATPADPQYGSLHFEVAGEAAPMSAATTAQSRTATLAILGRGTSSPALELTPPAWLAQPQALKPALRAVVSNNGQRHAPLAAVLQITDTTGRTVEASAGFGKWALPGQSVPLDFHLTAPLTPGQYQLQLQITTAEGVPPLDYKTLLVVPKSE